MVWLNNIVNEYECFFKNDRLQGLIELGLLEYYMRKYVVTQNLSKHYIQQYNLLFWIVY